MRVASVKIEELQRVRLLTLFLDECLCVQYLVQLPVQLIPVAFQLIRFRPHMLINIIECVHEYLIDLLSHLHRIFLDMLHLRHDLLQLLLDYVLLLSQRNVLRYSLRTSVRMRVLDPQYALI